MEGLDRLAVGSPHALDLLVSSLFNHGYQLCLEVCEHITIIDFVGPGELMNAARVSSLQCRRFDARLNQQLLEHLILAHGMRIPPHLIGCIDALREAHEYELETAILSSIMLLTERSVLAEDSTLIDRRIKMNHLFKWTNSLLRPPTPDKQQQQQQQSLYEQEQCLLFGDHDVFAVGYIDLNFDNGTKQTMAKAMRSDSSDGGFALAHQLDELNVHVNLSTSTAIDAVGELQTKIREHRLGIKPMSRVELAKVCD